MNILDQVISFLADQNTDVYLVGGLVRDQLLGRAVHDIDLAIDGDAVVLAREFADTRGGAFYLMDEEHNVARVILRDTYIDFAQLRGDLRTDLATRDFTINAMARQIGTDELFDPFHGNKDLQAKRVRAVSDTVFQDDPVRLLRAVRIAGELGFVLARDTEMAMRRDAALLTYASMERARDEFCKILALEDHVALLRRMDDHGLLGALLPEVAALKGITQYAPHVYDAFEHTLRVGEELEQIQAHEYGEVANGEFVVELEAHFAQTVSADRTRSTLLRLAALLHDIGKAVTRSVDDAGAVHFYEHESRGAEMCDAIMRRLRFSNDEIEVVTKIVMHHLRPTLLEHEARVSNRAVYRFFRDVGDAGIDVCALALADRRGTFARTSEDAEAQLRVICARLLEHYFRARDIVIAPPTLIDGRTLMRELELEPGPRVGELLEAIREAQVEGDVRTREEALAFARKQVDK